MSVYVDPIVTWGGGPNFPWKNSCHMYADTLQELHKMAISIGLKREWFQDKGMPHYDLVPSKRRLAVQKGAVQQSFKEAVALWRSKGWVRLGHDETV
jgi:hypothetical protein